MPKYRCQVNAVAVDGWELVEGAERADAACRAAIAFWKSQDDAACECTVYVDAGVGNWPNGGPTVVNSYRIAFDRKASLNLRPPFGVRGPARLDPGAA